MTAGGAHQTKFLKTVHCKECGKEILSMINKDVLCYECSYQKQYEMGKKVKDEVSRF